MKGKKISCFSIILISVLLFCTLVCTGLLFDIVSYKTAREAMFSADCYNAINNFNKLINVPRLFSIGGYKERALEGKNECQVFLDSLNLEAKGDLSKALVAFDKFLNNYPTSVLKNEVRAHMGSVIKNNWKAIVSKDTCRQINNLIDESEIVHSDVVKFLPNLYFACGGYFIATNDYTMAIKTFEALYIEYPMSTLTDSADKAIIESDLYCEDIEKLQNNSTIQSRRKLVINIFKECAEQYLRKEENQSAFSIYISALKNYSDSEFVEFSLTGIRKNSYSCVLAKENSLPEVIHNYGSLKPDIYFTCGNNFDNSGDYLSAITFYELFIKEYPKDSRSEDVIKKLARASIANAKANGAGNIPIPEKVNSSKGSKTTVVIRNDSPSRMRIIFSGPDTRIFELESCKECQTYYLAGPNSCPRKGPIGKYEISSGSYDVLVEAVGDDVLPFTGKWLLEGGEYSSCFFIVQTVSLH